MSNELSVLQNINPVEVFKAGGIDPILEAIRKEVADNVYDVSTNKGRNECRSAAAKVARSKTAIDKMGKELSDHYRAMIDPINIERRKAKEYLQNLQDEIRRPLTEWEDAEKERIASHESAIRDMEIMSQAADEFGEMRRSDTLKANLQELESTPMGDCWEEFAGQAAKTKDKCISELKGHIASREKYEAEQAELERLRLEKIEQERKEREDRIRREAEDKARREAEEAARVERERVDRERLEAERKAKEEQERAERERLQAIRQKEEAEARAKAQKEAAEREKKEAVERERKLAEEREQARIRYEQQQKEEAEEAERKRKANIEHRRQINKEILNCLVMSGLSEGDSKQVISLAAKGEAGRLTINY